MCQELINKINIFSQEIIKEEQRHLDYREKTEQMGDNNYLYKIDKEDKKLFKKNEKTIRQKKMKLESLISHLISQNF